MIAAECRVQSCAEPEKKHSINDPARLPHRKGSQAWGIPCLAATAARVFDRTGGGDPKHFHNVRRATKRPQPATVLGMDNRGFDSLATSDQAPVHRLTYERRGRDSSRGRFHLRRGYSDVCGLNVAGLQAEVRGNCRIMAFLPNLSGKTPFPESISLPTYERPKNDVSSSGWRALGMEPFSCSLETGGCQAGRRPGGPRCEISNSSGELLAQRPTEKGFNRKLSRPVRDEDIDFIRSVLGGKMRERPQCMISQTAGRWDTRDVFR